MAKSNTRSASCKNCLWYVLYSALIGWVALLYYFHAKSVPQVNPVPQDTKIDSQAPNNVETLKPTAPTPTVAPPEPAPTPIQSLHDGKTTVEVPKNVPATGSEEDLIHIVFSTDCSFFQDWQTLLVFHSAIRVKQRGQVTRIASGCDEDKQRELTDLYQQLFPKYHVHFTPDFKKDGKTNKKYDFYNKPFGLHHWLLNAQPTIEPGTIVILIDPDMILLRPFTLDFANNPANIFLPSFNPNTEKVPERLSRGHPVAQLYGLGAPWTIDHKAKNFNRTAICGENSPCLSVKRKFGEDHFSVGPPYILEKEDLLRLTDSWTKFVPRVFEKYPALLAEMYAYSMAAAHEELPHLTVLHMMVSNIDMDEEGWVYIDKLQEDVCQPPDTHTQLFYADHVMPSVLHFCQFYRIGEYGFQKRRLRKMMFECNAPLMAIPPANISTVRYKNRDGEIVKLGVKQSRRGTFMLCTIHYAINEMLLYYKSKMCPAEKINTKTSVNLVSKEFW